MQLSSASPSPCPPLIPIENGAGERSPKVKLRDNVDGYGPSRPDIEENADGLAGRNDRTGKGCRLGMKLSKRHYRARDDRRSGSNVSKRHNDPNHTVLTLVCLDWGNVDLEWTQRPWRGNAARCKPKWDVH